MARTAVDPNDPEHDDCVQHQPQQSGTENPEAEENNDGGVRVADGIGLRPAKPMVKPHLLRRWFPN